MPIFVKKRVRVLGKRLPPPPQFFLGVPPPPPRRGLYIDATLLALTHFTEWRLPCKNPQIENTKIIQDLRDEIARLREKLATSGRTGGTSKDDVLQMEVK